jgi:Uncharacterised nucleotidyltransferase
MTDTSTWATGVAAYGLGPPNGALCESSVEESEWPRLLGVARSQRLVGLLHQAAADGVIELHTGQRERLEDACQEVRAETQRVARSMADVAIETQRAGIDCRILKGPAFANLDYPSPELRPYVDMNMLVRSAQFVEALALLRTLGFERIHAEPAPGFDARFRKGTTLSAGPDMRLELHRTIADGPYAMIVEHDELFSSSSRIDVAGTELSALGAEERLLHACFEARVGDTRPLLIRLRDIVQLVLTHDLDIERIETLSGSWGAQSLVAEAIRRAWTLLGVTDIVGLSAWASTHPTSRKEKRRLTAYHRSRSRTLISAQTLGSIRPRRAVLSYMKAVTFPDRAYLDGYYNGHMNRWWCVTRSLVSRDRSSSPHDKIEVVPHPEEQELTELSWGQVAAKSA